MICGPGASRPAGVASRTSPIEARRSPPAGLDRCRWAQVQRRPPLGRDGSEHAGRHQPHQLGSRHGGSAGNGIEESGGANAVRIDEVARHLGLTAHVEAEGAHRVAAHLAGDLLGQRHVAVRPATRCRRRAPRGRRPRTHRRSGGPAPHRRRRPAARRATCGRRGRRSCTAARARPRPTPRTRRVRRMASAIVESSRGTNGTTSMAPVRGCTPGVIAEIDARHRDARDRRAASSTPSPASVSTVRLWWASVCMSSSDVAGGTDEGDDVLLPPAFAHVDHALQHGS